MRGGYQQNDIDGIGNKCEIIGKDDQKLQEMESFANGFIRGFTAYRADFRFIGDFCTAIGTEHG